MLFALIEVCIRSDASANLCKTVTDSLLIIVAEDTQSLVIIIENVPDILNFGGRNVPEEICALDWQIHVYGVATDDVRKICTDRFLKLHAFPWRAMTWRALVCIEMPCIC
jgi:phenylpyruvate tautomerase PptA (4-oxalocrotonate tautomerase family)